MKKRAQQPKKPPEIREPVPRLLAFDATPAMLIRQPMRSEYKGLWARLRREHFKQPDSLVCAFCGDAYPLTKNFPAHEVYAYPSPTVVQLTDVVIMCGVCHDAVHYERMLFQAGEPYRAALEAHYRRVNGGLSHAEFQQDVTDTRATSLALQNFYANARPVLDYGPFHDRVEQSRQRKEAWRHTRAGTLLAIKRIFDRAAVDDCDPGYFHPDNAETVLDFLRYSDGSEPDLAEIATRLKAGDVTAVRAKLNDLHEELYSEDGPWLPDHEYPQDTAMWRDSFEVNRGAAGAEQSPKSD